MTACQPLDPSKRCVLMERIAGHLQLVGVQPPTDHEVERAIPGGYDPSAAGVSRLINREKKRVQRKRRNRGQVCGLRTNMCGLRT